MDSCIKTRTATKNKIHGKEILGASFKYGYRSLMWIKKFLDKEISGIEKKLLSFVKQEEQVQLTLLRRILGIGVKTGLFMIVITDGFTKF